MSKIEIEFRGKRIDNGEWVFGNVFYDKTGTTDRVFIIPEYVHDECDEFSDMRCLYLRGYEVDHETVGQYTGLKDQNDKKIYEGCKISFTVFDCFDNDTQYTGYVVWAESKFMIWNKIDNEFYGSDGGFDLGWVHSQDDTLEVIGNIHDNPELINKE